jgi:hypothetical protein
MTFPGSSRRLICAGRIMHAVVVALVLFAVATLAASAQAASPAWKPVGATGPTHLPPFTGERQAVTPPFFGTFTLTFGADTTSAIAPNAPATGPGSVQEALNALPSINTGGGSVTVSIGGTSNGAITAWIVTFDGGPLAGTDVPLMSAAGFGAGVAPAASGNLAVWATNVGGQASSGTVTMTIGPLPAGITTAGTGTGGSPSNSWSCTPGGGHTTVTCTLAASVFAGTVAAPVTLPVVVGPGAASTSTVPVEVEGGGAAPDPLENNRFEIPIVLSAEDPQAGISTFWAGAFDDDGRPYTQAGGHPARAGVFFLLNTRQTSLGDIRPVSNGKQVDVKPPPGFVGNPLVTDRCPPNDPTGTPNDPTGCPPDAIVGLAGPIIQRWNASIVATESTESFDTASFPIYNVQPKAGNAAEFAFPYITAIIRLAATLRSDEDNGVTVSAPNIPLTQWAFGSFSMLDGKPAGAGGKAFLSNPTECNGQPAPTTLVFNTWQDRDVFDQKTSDSPPTTDCDQVPFAPAASFSPTTTAADSPSGLDVEFDVPQGGLLDANGLVTSHLKKTVVTLPEGVSVNPSGATGLAGCSDAGMGVRGYGFAAPAPVRFTKDDPFDGEGAECPEASKIGTVEVTTPVLEETLTGDVVLGEPKSTDPASGQMLRLFLVLRNKERGLLVKIHGTSTADPATGQLRATFDNNPQLPFDELSVELKGGSRGVLATPPRCGTTAATGWALTPWSRAHLPAGQQNPVAASSDWPVDSNCAFGFNPGLRAGMSTPGARQSGTFSFRFSRNDGDQVIDGLTAQLPPGLLASVKDVPLCSSAQAAAGACPAGSRIGTVDATAGAGDPFVLERKGSAYLTEGYKGCAYGLSVVVPVVAGPFDASSPEKDLGNIVVRQSVCVDPTDAHLTVTSDPVPTIWHGVPLRVRSVTVNIDREKFTLNPSDCAAKQVAASFHSPQNTGAQAGFPFQATGCKDLAFKPRLRLALTGRKQVSTGKHPGVKAVVTQTGIGEAGIEKTVVRLPRSLALDPDNAQALCEYTEGTKPDLEHHCPKGSIVGRARAVSPLLKQPLSGNVYFVKNVRTDPRTGNQIRTLPMIIVALRGEVAINLKGESSTTRAGKLVNTFDHIPDAPITQFNLNIKGGNTGILTVTRTARAKINLCTGRHTAEADIDGHNGRRADQDIRMKTPCPKAGKKARKGSRRAKR